MVSFEILDASKRMANPMSVEYAVYGAASPAGMIGLDAPSREFNGCVAFRDGRQAFGYVETLQFGDRLDYGISVPKSLLADLDAEPGCLGRCHIAVHRRRDVPEEVRIHVVI